MVHLGSLAVDSRVADAIYDAIKREAEDWRRDHLGASIIGDENCRRSLWYSFRWATNPNHDGKLLRLFGTGKREEVRLIEDLRRAGFRVDDVHVATGRQFRVSFVRGHFGGSLDGTIIGVPAAPKTPHLLELKSANAKKFAEFVSKGVKVANPGYYAQMQTYMHGHGIKRALFLVVCKDDERIHCERIHLDPKFAKAIVAKAESVVDSPVPMERISEDPTWFECRFCHHRTHCHERRFETIERNCRTCAHSTPVEDGQWKCELQRKVLSPAAQREGCHAHLFVPQMLSHLDPIDASDPHDAAPWVEYRSKDGKLFLDRDRKLVERTS